MKLRIGMSALAVALLCLTHLLDAGAIDYGTATINGDEVQYVLGELLIKPVPATAASAIAGPLGASVLDSIPRIGWYRLKFSDGVDVVPIWQTLENDPRLQSCGFNLAYPVLHDSSAAGEAARTDPKRRSNGLPTSPGRLKRGTRSRLVRTSS
jgi:hypothetical protein